MKPSIIWLFRSPEGRVISRSAPSANDAANLIGYVLSWDSDLNTLDLVRHGRAEVWTFLGHRETAKCS